MAKEYKYEITDEKLKKIYNSDHIIINENDLKYKNNTNINIDRIKDLNGKPYTVDKDTIEYRINECKKENGITLDLSHLRLQSLPEIPESLHNTIKFLFISGNNIQKIDVSFLSKLIVLDICTNNLNMVPILPTYIEELLIKDNKLVDINELSKYGHLKRLDCSQNNIETIPVISSLEILICNKNRIKKIPKYMNLIKLLCPNNNIDTINDLPYLEILDCENNNLTKLGCYNNLQELYCNRNNIKTIHAYPKIELIHCHSTNIKKIEYMSTLRELLCDYNNDLILSKYFKIVSSDIYSNDIILLKFK